MDPDLSVSYADHADGVVDIHRPHAPGDTTVVLLHGGFWRTTYDRRHTRPMARALADAGLTVLTPEYRRGDGAWPRTAADVATVIESAGRLTTTAGAERSDRVVVTGHSAGGHLALWLATQTPTPAAVVALAPVCDLTAADRLRLGSGAVRDFFGGAPDHAADPMVALPADREDRGCPVTVVHPVDDDTVPVDLSRRLVARHPWIALDEVAGGHFAVITPGSHAFAVVVRRLTGSTD